jgi:hypothetical protein
MTGFMKSVEFDLKKMEHEAKSGFMNAYAATRPALSSVRLAHEAVGKAAASH